MRTITMTPPGRFPTVIFDPGVWWDVLAADGAWKLERQSTSYSWWRVICNPDFRDIALAPLSWSQSVRRRTEWRAANIDLSHSGAKALEALDALTSWLPYRNVEDYIGTVSAISSHLRALNDAQNELTFSIEAGARVRGLNYGDSAALAAYARQDTLLYRLIAKALTDLSDCEFLALHASSPEDLLTAMIVTFLARTQNPNIYVCLFDHGYENFSLHAHMETLRLAGTLDLVFDSILESKDERDLIMPALVRAVRDGKAPRGFLKASDVPGARPSGPVTGLPPEPIPTFSPEPVLWTRLSKRRCYWSRCSFCTQNTKYDDPRAPMHAEIPETLKRIARFRDLGFRTFIFSDEAISPSSLGHLCRELDESDLRIKWACRCKLEKAFSAELFERMGRVGCYEILYGLESTSERMLKLMDKFVEGMDEDRIAEIFQDMDNAGIGVHVNMIGGFPGDRLPDTEASVDFVIRALRKLHGATYLLNAFALFPDTPILSNPNAFGIAPASPDGDMPGSYDFILNDEIGPDTQDVYEKIPRLREKLDDALGWSDLTASPGGTTAMTLYFGFGHGSIFKAERAGNPFANPLKS